MSAALEAEASGFDVAVIGDHIGPELVPPPTLAAIAAATISIRLDGSPMPEVPIDGAAHPMHGTRSLNGIITLDVAT